MDKLLCWIVNNVEKGTLKKAGITVVIPGGIFSGELIPTWQYVQIMGRAIYEENSTPPNGQTEPKEEADVPQVPVEDSEYLHLLSPTTLSSNEYLVMPALRVRIAASSA